MFYYLFHGPPVKAPILSLDFTDLKQQNHLALQSIHLGKPAYNL